MAIQKSSNTIPFIYLQRNSKLKFLKFSQFPRTISHRKIADNPQNLPNLRTFPHVFSLNCRKFFSVVEICINFCMFRGGKHVKIEKLHRCGGKKAKAIWKFELFWFRKGSNRFIFIIANCKIDNFRVQATKWQKSCNLRWMTRVDCDCKAVVACDKHVAIPLTSKIVPTFKIESFLAVWNANSIKLFAFLHRRRFRRPRRDSCRGRGRSS